MAIQLPLPPAVNALLAALHAAGYCAYVVGGCVRDSLLGRPPGDWDICTSATPPQIKALFAADRLLLAGEKHGTVTVLRGGAAYEITTFRLDGAYSDNRRPDAVTFVPDVRQDLSRRDFTVNAMAWAPGEGLVDAFGGQADLAAGIIRCVGAPDARFGEDALRILRALRFAAQLDFTVEPSTAAAALALRDTLQNIAAERLFAELDKLLAGRGAARVLACHGAILAGVLPEIAPCLGCTQGPGHIGDVWQHTATAVGALPPGQDADTRLLRWALLLHDLAKPACRSVDAAGRPHFHGHNQRGARQAEAILRRLKAPAALITGVPPLIAVHDMPLPDTDPAALRLMARCGAGFPERLCRLKLADLDAHAATPITAQRRQQTLDLAARVARLRRTGCWTVRQLHVNGADALAAGIAAGPAVGWALQTLLERVMDGVLPNERAALLAALADLAKKPGTKAAPPG